MLTLMIGMMGCAPKESSSVEKSQTPATKTEENTSEEPSEKVKLEGKVIIVGSTSVTPFAEKIADTFMENNDGVKVDVQGVGSSAGVKAAADGTGDIGMASRNLKDAEKEWGIEEHILAYDGIAVVLNPANSVTELTTDQVTSIFKGEITNWKELGGQDKEIIVVSREAGSGTRGAFEGIMNLLEKNDAGKKVSVVMPEALIADGNGAVKSSVATKDYAIGYISLGYLDDSVKGMKIDGAEPTVANILEGKYSVSRPFLLITKGEIDPLTQAYLDFALSDAGQELISDKLIPINK